jgi:hypothetical protein
MYLCMYVCVCVCIYVCMCVCVCVYVCMYVCMYVCAVPMLSLLNFAVVSKDRRSDETARTFMEAVVA